MKRQIYGGFALALASISILFLGETAWIQGKAIVAQVLMERAWARTKSGGKAAPWPWADTKPVAVLEVPGQEIRQMVLAGASGRTLAFGPAHMDESAAPNEDGTIVLIGHRDTHFAFLEEISIGEILRLTDASGKARAFRIAETAVADIRHTRLRIDSAGSRSVLVACYPFDAFDPGGPLRYVVTAVGLHR